MLSLDSFRCLFSPLDYHFTFVADWLLLSSLLLESHVELRPSKSASTLANADVGADIDIGDNVVHVCSLCWFIASAAIPQLLRRRRVSRITALS